MDPYLETPVTPTKRPDTVDPKSLPLYLCNRKGKRFILIKRKLDAEQMGLLRSNMYLLHLEHILTPEERAEVRRATAAAEAADSRKDGTS
jgi:hypothetical protein